MIADEIRLRIEQSVSLIAGDAVDPISDDAGVIEDVCLDAQSIIESLVVAHGFHGGRRRVATPVAQPVPPYGAEPGCGVRLDLRPRARHTLQRASRDLGGQARLHTISRLDCQEANERPVYASRSTSPTRSSRPVGSCGDLAQPAPVEQDVGDRGFVVLEAHGKTSLEAWLEGRSGSDLVSGFNGGRRAVGVRLSFSFLA